MNGRALAAIAAIACAALAGCAPDTPQAADPGSYRHLCSTALVNVQFATHQLTGAQLTPNDPAILSPGPPVRVQCGLVDDTYIGAVTFDALCGDFMQSGCARVTAAVMDGRIVYVSQDAMSAVRQAAGGRHHRHHRS